MATRARAKSEAVEESTAPAAESNAAAPVAEKKKRKTLPLATAHVGEFEAVEESNPFARGSRDTLPEDHPVQKAFDHSTETGKVLAVTTETPDITTKMLRIAATRRDRGVRINAKVPGKIVFQSTVRKKRTPKPKPTA